jgi:hypothetical protein
VEALHFPEHGFQHTARVYQRTSVTVGGFSFKSKSAIAYIWNFDEDGRESTIVLPLTTKLVRVDAFPCGCWAFPEELGGWRLTGISLLTI